MPLLAESLSIGILQNNSGVLKIESLRAPLLLFYGVTI
jgi:hypothetical protein